ncbi:MAG TPA: zinc ribbon domain-containing protein [Ktedonobacteraceae bacterium]|nr:zinc ribbon domain-containing protein [Ktedonobacteraceae bacterium]
MAQALPRFCPRCGTPTVAGQTNCANCGLYLLNPRPLSPMQPPVQPVQFAPPVLVPSQPITTGNIAPSFRTTQSQGSTRRRGPGRMGKVLIVLVLLVLLGAGSYLVFALLNIHGTGLGLGGNNSQAPITTTQVHETVTYAGVEVTVLNAQQSQNFLNDPNSSTDGMLRLNLQEHNSTTVKISWLYSDITQLVLPGGKTVTPTYAKATVGIAPGATQNSYVDFAVPITDKVSQLALRLGASNEAQMDIPLTGNANLSKYAPASVKPDGQLQYFGLNWTLVSATSQYSITGQQASKGMRYVVVTLSVDNTLSQVAITGSPFTYIRLQSGNSNFTPVDTTLPVSFDTGVTGKSGTVTFLVPQKSTAFTLALVPQNQSGATQVTTDFQLS